MSEVLVQNVNLQDSGMVKPTGSTYPIHHSASLGASKIAANNNGGNDAYIVDTKAIFVRTPDGIVHRKEVSNDGVKYSPDITHSSYQKK